MASFGYGEVCRDNESPEKSPTGLPVRVWWSLGSIRFSSVRSQYPSSCSSDRFGSVAWFSRPLYPQAWSSPCLSPLRFGPVGFGLLRFPFSLVNPAVRCNSDLSSGSLGPLVHRPVAIPVSAPFWRGPVWLGSVCIWFCCSCGSVRFGSVAWFLWLLSFSASVAMGLVGFGLVRSVWICR